MQPLETHDPLTCFFYVLLRDHLAAGFVEEVMRNHVERPEHLEPGGDFTAVLSNGHLAAYAEELTERMAKVGTCSSG